MVLRSRFGGNWRQLGRLLLVRRLRRHRRSAVKHPSDSLHLGRPVKVGDIFSWNVKKNLAFWMK